MKSFLLYFFLTLGTLFTYAQIEVTLPNDDIEVTDNTLLYLGTPFSGKIIMNPTDKADGYEGFINFKEGALDGLTELKNENKKQSIVFTIVNKQFEGDIIMVEPEQNINMKLKVNKGIITRMAANLGSQEAEQKYNLTFKNNLANGTMEVTGGGQTQKMNFKDGIYKIPNLNAEVKLSINPKNGDMIIETSQSGKVLQTQTVPNQIAPKIIEKQLFDAIKLVNAR